MTSGGVRKWTICVIGLLIGTERIHLNARPVQRQVRVSQR